MKKGIISILSTLIGGIVGACVVSRCFSHFPAALSQLLSPRALSHNWPLPLTRLRFQFSFFFPFLLHNPHMEGACINFRSVNYIGLFRNFLNFPT